VRSSQLVLDFSACTCCAQACAGCNTDEHKLSTTSDAAEGFYVPIVAGTGNVYTRTSSVITQVGNSFVISAAVSQIMIQDGLSTQQECALYISACPSSCASKSHSLDGSEIMYWNPLGGTMAHKPISDFIRNLLIDYNLRLRLPIIQTGNGGID